MSRLKDRLIAYHEGEEDEVIEELLNYKYKDDSTVDELPLWQP